MAVINLTPASRPVQSGRSLAQVPVQGVPGAIEAAGGLGAGIARAADAVGQFAEKMQESDDLLALSRARIAGMDSIGQAQIEAGRGTDYANAPERFSTAALERIRTQADQLSPRIRDRFIAGMQEVVASRVPSVRQEAFQQQSQATVAQRGEELRSLGHQVAAARNPVERATLMGQADTSIRELVESGAVTEAGAARLRQGFRSDVAKAEIGALISRSPGEALRAINSGRWNDAMDADSIQAYRDRADAAVARAEARAEAAANRAERRVAVELQQVNGLFAAGIVPTERVERLQAMARGTIYESQIPGMVATAREVGRFAAMSATQQAETLATYEARARAPNATDADLTAYQRFAQIRQRQRTDILQDGIGRAVQDGIVPPLPPVDWNNADSIAAYVQAGTAAAQAAASRYGMPVSILTGQFADQLRDRITAGNEADRWSLLRAVNSIPDPQIRRETVLHLERFRGEGGRLPAGSLAVVMDQMNHPDLTVSLRARRLLNALTAPTDARARQFGENQAFQAALVKAQTEGLQGVLAAQVRLGGPAYQARNNTSMAMIRDVAISIMAGGETDPAAAVRDAASLVNAGRNAINDPRLGVVTWRSDRASPDTMRSGLEVLHNLEINTARAALNQPLDSNAGIAARNRRDAVMDARWINMEDRFALTAAGAGGFPVVLRTATIAEVLAAAQGQRELDARTPPPVRQENAIQQRERARREAERGAMTAPVLQ